MEFITEEEAEARWFQLIDAVQQGKSFTITIDGRPAAVLQPHVDATPPRTYQRSWIRPKSSKFGSLTGGLSQIAPTCPILNSLNVNTLKNP
jgi:prevent-host-death family protein